MVRNEKTLVLSVDRDNDFGVKAGVVTPVIGIDHCMKAATALAVADPEDSDVNGLFAAIRMYKDLKADGRDVEIALICGDKNVGHKSDSIVIDQLEEVLEKVAPQRVMLVGDGAEDEYINPIISSRVPIDSVKKVYVKQAPGLESTIYVLAKMISDPDKKKRFFTPIGSVLMILGLFFIIEGVLLFYATGNGEYIYGQTWSIVIFVIGFFLILHGYGLIDRLIEYVEYGVKNIRSGNVAITFSLLSLALIIVGISVGIYSIWDTQIKDPMYIVSEFAVNALWPIIFAIMFWDIGKLVNNFIKLKKVNRSFLVGTIAVIGIGFLLQGLLDTISTILGYGAVDNMSILLEFIGGIILTVSASILQSNFRRYFNKKKEMI
ncbi:MAG: DUF373 family protein [Thermoplasmata archaeon]|nr:DUF373 family protein [Thermoplasmata archaeon]